MIIYIIITGKKQEGEMSRKVKRKRNDKAVEMSKEMRKKWKEKSEQIMEGKRDQHKQSDLDNQSIISIEEITKYVNKIQQYINSNFVFSLCQGL